MRCRSGRSPVWFAITICCGTSPSAAAYNGLPPDLGPILEHVAIASEMVRVCAHVRPDLGAQLREAWSAWWSRNARVQETLVALKHDAARVESKNGVPGLSPSMISRREAAEILDGYKALRLSLRHEVEEQAQRGNLKFVRNCDEVLVNLSSGHLDYQPPSK